MVTFESHGDLSKVRLFLEKAKNTINLSSFKKYGDMGVDALELSTPMDTGVTAASWTYDIRNERNGIVIEWKNSNNNDGVPIALLIQYGHATGTGGYVSGRDYINPAMQPIFDQIAEEMWKEVNG